MKNIIKQYTRTKTAKYISQAKKVLDNTKKISQKSK